MTASEDILALMTPLTSKEELQDWILVHLGFELPDTVVSRFADSSPLDFVWEAYQSIVQGKPLSMMALAGRDSAKTVGLSIIDLLAFLHDKRDTVHVAMTSEQAKRAKAYLEGYTGKISLLKQAITKQNEKQIKIKIDNEEVGMEILPATPKAVQGAHCSLLTFDELASSMEPNNVRAIKDASGIVGTSRTGKAAVVIKITSRQAGYSLAEQEIRLGKTKIRKWTTFENTEKCSDERSGTVPTPLMVNHLKGEQYTIDEFRNLEPAKQDGFYKTDSTFDKCRQCPLASICQGDLKKQKSKSALLRKIDDVVTKIEAAGSWDWALAQIMSLKPSTEGLIYWEFDRRIHVPGWDAMWEVLTQEKPTRPVNREMFIRELKKRRAVFYAGLDWGFNPSPSVVVVMAVDRRGFMYVVEAVARIKVNDPEFIESVVRNDMQPRYNVQMWCPDLANGSGRDLLKQAGVPVTDDIDKTIMLGVNLVKGCLRVPGGNGKTRILLAPDLDQGLPRTTEGPIDSIYDEFELYHKKTDAAGRVLDMDNPDDGYDHFLDALRYMIYWLIGRGRAEVAFGGADYGPSPGNPFQARDTSTPTNVPSAHELLRQQGISFEDNSEEPSGDLDDGKPPEAGGPIWRWT